MSRDSKSFAVAEETPRPFRSDVLGIGFAAIHLAIVAYVIIGWTIPSRTFLFVYLLALPMFILQWLLNSGSSVMNNFENVVRIGCWNDSRNELEGAFFKCLLREVGLFLPDWSINIVVCALMWVFWIEAIWRMILIVPPP
jgi:hypothetical protein